MKNRHHNSRLFYSTIIFFAVMMFCSILLYGGSVYYQQRQLLINEYGKMTKGVAEAVAASFNSNEYRDYLKKYIKTLEKDEKYDEIAARISNFQKVLNVTYIYVFTVKNDKEVYIFDAYIKSDITYQLGDIETDDYELAAQIMRTGKFIKGHELTHSQRFGALVTSYAPIYDSNGDLLALVGVDYRVSEILTKLNRFIGITLTQSTILLAIFTLFAFYYFHHKIIHPIEYLAKSMTQFAKDPTEKPSEENLVSLKTGNEIELLGNAYNVLILKIDEYIKKIRDSVSVRERTKGELQAAQSIQMSLLPNNLSPYSLAPNVSVVGNLHSAREVGGDLYDVFSLDDDHLALAIGDVSGKGIAAALFMAVTQTFQRSAVLEKQNIDEMANRLNKFLHNGNTEFMFVTWFGGILNIKTGELTYTCAGHNPPILKRNDGSVLLLDECHGPPLGIISSLTYQSSRIMLQDGDMLVLYTDGITETKINEEFYGLDRLSNLIAQTPLPSPDVAIQVIKDAIGTFAPNIEPADDQTILVIQFHAPENIFTKENN